GVRRVARRPPAARVGDQRGRHARRVGETDPCTRQVAEGHAEIRSLSGGMLNSRPRLFLLLLLVFLGNCGETWYVTSSHPSTPITPIEYKTAYAVHQFERGVVDFDFHDRTVGWG